MEQNAIRPQTLSEFIGQETVKKKLLIYLETAKKRNEPADHVLLYGPPGLGKTTLTGIVANELGVDFHMTSGAAIEKQDDFNALLAGIHDGDVLFIDEINRLSRQIEVMLYSEPFSKYTIIGATTREGQLSAPLKDKFGVILQLEMYTLEELSKIIARSAKILGIDITRDAVAELAAHAKGTPRTANRLLKRARDVVDIMDNGVITINSVKNALLTMKIGKLGLNAIDIKLLSTIIDEFNGGPVGLERLATAIGEKAVTIEDGYEPYLMKIGFLYRTPRGRCVTSLAYRYLGIEQPNNTFSEAKI